MVYFYQLFLNTDNVILKLYTSLCQKAKCTLCMEHCTSTSRPPDVTHVINETRPSPFFALFPLPCIILNANRRTKNGGGLGTRLRLQVVEVALTDDSTLATFFYMRYRVSSLLRRCCEKRLESSDFGTGTVSQATKTNGIDRLPCSYVYRTSH